MIDVGRLARDADTEQRRNVGERIGQRMEPIRYDADRAGGEAQHELGDGDGEIEEEDFERTAATAL